MKSFLETALVLNLLLVTGIARSKPLEVIYKDEHSTKFTWHWPQTTHRVTNYLQTKPYYYTGRLINMANEDVSKYRFYYTQRTCMNPWGYFFHPSDKLCTHEILHFPSPTSGDRVIIVKY